MTSVLDNPPNENRRSIGILGIPESLTRRIPGKIRTREVREILGDGLAVVIEPGEEVFGQGKDGVGFLVAWAGRMILRGFRPQLSGRSSPGFQALSETEEQVLGAVKGKAG